MSSLKIGKTKYELIYVTKDGFQILVTKGTKSKSDFKVKYRKPDTKWKSGFTRPRMPKHIHVIVELYAKYGANPKLTLKLHKYFLKLLGKARPLRSYPPRLHFFKKRLAKKFKKLDKYGEFSSEFLMVFVELLLTQEKTNYSKMIFSRNLFTSFADDEVYRVVNLATLRTGRRMW